MIRGSQLCIKHVNDKGGVLGRRIELLIEDDQSNGPTAAALYEKLITRDKVDAPLAPYPARAARDARRVIASTRAADAIRAILAALAESRERAGRAPPLAAVPTPSHAAAMEA